MNIANQSMIAQLSSGLPPQTVKLPEEAEEIAEKKKAQKGTVKASMNYFRKPDPQDSTGKRIIDGLQPLKDFINEYRSRFHSLARYPYKGEFYLVPAASVDELTGLKEQFEGQKRWDVWQNWADHEYDKWKNEAPARMGDLYAKAGFPSLSDCMSRFYVEMTIIPLAPKEQVERIALIAPKTQTFLKEHADEASKKAVEELHKQIWQDLMKPLQHIVTTFEKDKSKIHESLLGNLHDIVNVIPNYDAMLGDPNLQSAAAKVKSVLGKLTVEDLRSSEESRKLALSSAKDMVATFTPFARKFV